MLLRELRTRGLTELTEAYSRKRLADPNLDPAGREAAAVELATTTSRRASMETDAAARRAGWAEADAAVEPWLRAANRAEPEAFEFRLRHALMIRERAETVVELLKAVPNDKNLAEDARAQAQAAADLLTKLAEEVRRRMNQSVGGDPKKFDRLANLDIQVDFHAGIAWAVTAAAHPTGAAKTNAAEEAEKRLRGYTRTFSILALNMEAILALGKLYKDMERYDEALQVVSAFEVHPEAPAPYPQRAELLAAQVLLAQDKPVAALAKLEVPENKRVPNSGEWSVTLFEAKLRGAPFDRAPTKKRRDDAFELLASLEQKFGRYWKVRGEQVLAKFGGPEVVGDNPALLARVAGLRRERKEFDAAVAMFDRAAGLERAGNAPEQAARMDLSAAATTLEKGDVAGATERYLKAAENAGQTPLAADALLGAARALHPAVQSGDRKAKAAYRHALDRLLTLPRTAPSMRHEANWLRGRVAESEKDYAAAIERYREIPAGHPRAAAALGAMAAVHYTNLLGSAGKLPGDRAVVAAIEDLESRIRALPPSDSTASKHRATASWVVARLIAEYKPDRLPDAVRLVEASVVTNPSFPVAQNRVWQFLLTWQLRLGDVKGATGTINRGFGNDSKGLAEVLLALSPLEDGLAEPEAAARAAAAQAAVDAWLGRSDQLPDRTRVSFKLLAGQALAARKSYSDAVRLLRQLREEFPRDPRVPAVLGRALFLAGEYRDSLKEWSSLIGLGGLRPGDEEWLAAVVEAARCHLELGDRASASALLKMAEARGQGKGSATIRKRLAELQRRVER